jgi:hypothetical protein
LLWLPGTPSGKMLLTTGPGPAGPSNPPPAAAADGAFVIIADDFPYSPFNTSHAGGAADYSLPPNIPGYYNVGALNGRIFRLGRPNTEDFNVGVAFGPGWYDLDPQYGMRQPVTLPGASAANSPDMIPNLFMWGEMSPGSTPAPVPGSGYAKCYIIGAGKDPSTGQVAGNSQDVGVFATYFQVQ